MLQQGFAAVGHRRDDLLVRVHVLSRLRGQPARRTLPELRRQLRRAPDSPAVEARQQSSIDGARVQAGGLQYARDLELSDPLSGARAVPDKFGALALFPGFMVRSRAATGPPSFVNYRARRLEP
jgi:hypothetical protein